MSAPTRRHRRRFKKQASERPPVVPFTPDNDAALCYVRQSHFSDESMSSEVQTRDTHRWANAYDVPIVETVEDLHVSGARSFQDRLRGSGPARAVWVAGGDTC